MPGRSNSSEQVDHKPSIAQTLQFRGEFFIILDRLDEAEACASICQSIAKNFSLGNYLDYANLMQGWVSVMRGDVDNGLRQAEAALLAMRSIASAVSTTRFRSELSAGPARQPAISMARSPSLTTHWTKYRSTANAGTRRNCFA